MQRGKMGRFGKHFTLGDAHFEVARRVQRRQSMLNIGARIRYARQANPALEETSLTRPRYGRVEGFYSDKLVQVSWDDGLGPQTVPADHIAALCPGCGKPEPKSSICPCGA